MVNPRPKPSSCAIFRLLDKNYLCVTDSISVDFIEDIHYPQRMKMRLSSFFSISQFGQEEDNPKTTGQIAMVLSDLFPPCRY